MNVQLPLFTLYFNTDLLLTTRTHLTYAIERLLFIFPIHLSFACWMKGKQPFATGECSLIYLQPFLRQKNFKVLQ